MAVSLAVLAGCGGSTASPSLSGTREIPKGYGLYHGPGFSIAVPVAWRRAPYQTDSDHSGVSFVPPGPTAVDATLPRVDTELSTPTSQFPAEQDFAEFVANLKDAATTTVPSGQRLADTVTVASAKVPGASEAKLVTLLGPGPKHETYLVTLTSRGVTAVDVSWDTAANESVNPTAVIDSFRLEG